MALCEDTFADPEAADNAGVEVFIIGTDVKGVFKTSVADTGQFKLMVDLMSLTAS